MYLSCDERRYEEDISKKSTRKSQLKTLSWLESIWKITKEIIMIEFENKKYAEEMEEEKKTKIETKRAPRKHEHSQKGIRSVSRHDITQLKFEDPRIALKEIPLNKAKERRQKIIQENREARKEKEWKETTTTEEDKDAKQITKMIKELTLVLKSYMENTSKEIENIKTIIENNHKAFIMENKKNESDKREIESKIKK